MRSSSSAAGLSLVEVLVATALVASAVGGLAHLAAHGVRQAAAARHTTAALMLAQSKLEELRAEPWTYDANGTPVSSPALALSSPDAIVTDEAGHVDELDVFGASVAAAGSAAYRRRWAVTSLDTLGGDTLLLKVCVYVLTNDLGRSRRPEACVSTVRTRRP